MKATLSISDVFPKYLFWDMDHTTLDPKKDADIIIPRALIASTPDTFPADIARLENFYNSRQIIKELKATKERVSNHICSLVAERYHVADFKRFSK